MVQLTSRVIFKDTNSTRLRTFMKEKIFAQILNDDWSTVRSDQNRVLNYVGTEVHRRTQGFVRKHAILGHLHEYPTRFETETELMIPR